ncbi:MAG: TolC family protein [Parachlamydiaceae bacterium]|nr:TolC family protein [Parachlamydiaceae bacterium]
MFSSKSKHSLALALCLLIGLTSCATRGFQEEPEIPCKWHTPLEKGISDDPVSFLWLEALHDPVLMELVEQVMSRNNDIRLARLQCKGLSETINSVVAETAKSYIELRGLQQRSKILQESIDVQQKITVLEEGLSESYISAIDQNESKKNLEGFFVQKSLTDLSLKKVIFRLSTLLSYPPGELNECLIQSGELPQLPCQIPIGLPIELLARDCGVQDLKNLYLKTSSDQAFYPYQKQILTVLEEAENALAAFYYSLEKTVHLANSKKLKEESYQFVKDLYEQGIKDERDVLTAHLELLSQESSLIDAKSELLLNYITLYKSLRGFAP